MPSDVKLLRAELSERTPWGPVDEALARWVMLPWYHRTYHWLVTLW